MLNISWVYVNCQVVAKIHLASGAVYVRYLPVLTNNKFAWKGKLFLPHSTC